VILSAALLAVESAAMIVVVGILIIDLLTQQAQRLDTAIALTVLAVIAAAWICAVTAAFWRGRSWSRAGALTWQILQIAVAVGSFQGVFAQPAVGWALLIPSLAVIVLLVSKSVVAHTRPEGPEPHI